MPSLMRLQLTDVIALGSALRAESANATGLKESADRMSSFLHDMSGRSAARTDRGRPAGRQGRARR